MQNEFCLNIKRKRAFIININIKKLILKSPSKNQNLSDWSTIASKLGIYILFLSLSHFPCGMEPMGGAIWLGYHFLILYVAWTPYHKPPKYLIERNHLSIQNVLLIPSHILCNCHFISVCKVQVTKTEVQIFGRIFHTHLYLNQVIVEFLFCKKKKSITNQQKHIYIYIYIFFFFKGRKLTGYLLKYFSVKYFINRIYT